MRRLTPPGSSYIFLMFFSRMNPILGHKPRGWWNRALNQNHEVLNEIQPLTRTTQNSHSRC